jgi:spore coat protein U-like protein
VPFGSVDVVSGNNYSASANISINCTMGLLSVGTINYSICVGVPGASGSTPRSMNSAVSYNLYADSAHSTVWGAYGGTPGLPNPPNAVSLTTASLLLGGSASTTIPIYGYLQSSQNTSVAAGSYSQTLTATLNYNYTYSLLGTPATPTPCTSNGGTTSGGTFPLTASATVINDCIVTATSINFGVGVLTAALGATGTVSAKCTSGDSYTIALNKGTTSGASLGNRLMAGSGSAVVQYQLYTNSGYSAVWGDGTSGTSTGGGTGAGSTQNYTVFGLVPAQTTPAPNTYSDTVTVTVTY